LTFVSDSYPHRPSQPRGRDAHGQRHPAAGLHDPVDEGRRQVDAVAHDPSEQLSSLVLPQRSEMDVARIVHWP